MRSVDATPLAIEKLRKNSQSETPVTMLNLLRYRERAVYPDDYDAEPCSGREAYQRYGAVAGALVGEAGGRPIWMGSANDAFIAPEGETWDDVVLVYYPSRKHFIDMIESAEYQAAKPHRTAVLEDSRLIETTPLFGPAWNELSPEFDERRGG